MTSCKLLIFLCLLTINTFCVNADENNKVENEVTNKTESATVLKPLIKYIHYNSTISNRYAVTKVSSNVANRANVSQEVHFSLVLPETAFISEFLMIIKEKEYKAYVKEKEEAKQVYDAAVAAGQTAAHVEQSVRDSNRFQVSVNVEAEGKITFVLTYEELLSRSLGVYTHTVNVNPGQIVKDLQVEVHIQEPVDITLLKVPNFKTKNEIASDDEQDNPLAVIKRDPSNKKNATVLWAPTVEEQMKIEKDGLKGQLVVKYDVDRSKSSQILLDEGYFVHFFTPDSSAPPLAKHVVFVLDISGSMHGRKIEQLREAMVKILDDLHEQDYFSIILFSSDVIVWSPLKTQHLFKEEYSAYNFNDEEVVTLIKRRDQNEILMATKDNVNKAKEFINKIRATDATNIMGGLREGLNISSEGQTKFLTESNSGLTPQPLIVFLTDGDPNVEISDPNEIVNVTYNLNEIRCPIYSLAFGDGADLQFLRRLSLKNYGFGRNIYEASDAVIQLNNFYKEISSPLMSDVTFDYLPGQVENGTLTRTSFPVFFLGNEFIIAGKLADPSSTKLDYTVNATKSSDATKNYNPDGGFCVIFPPTEILPPKEANHTLGHLEKLWAFLTIRQLLDKDSTAGSSNSNDTSPEKKEALKLALKYSFVTPLTSLVVVKPNETQSVEPEKASNNGNRFGGNKHGGSRFGVNNYHTHKTGGFGYGMPLSIMAARPQSGFGAPVLGKKMFISPPLKRGVQFAKRIAKSKSRQFSFRKSVPLSQQFNYDETDDKVYRVNRIQDYIKVGASYASFAGGFSGGIPMNGPPPSAPPFSPGPFVAQEPISSTAYIPAFDVTEKSEPSVVPLDSLKWLPSHGNDEEFIIDVPSHGNYTVGYNLTDVPLVDGCQVGNETTTYSYNGTCHHLKYCALSTFVDSVEQYVSYFCAMANNYAGVCCPF